MFLKLLNSRDYYVLSVHKTLPYLRLSSSYLLMSIVAIDCAAIYEP